MATIGIPNQTAHEQAETRVAVTPDSLRRIMAMGLEVAIESNAGRRAGFDDEHYRAAGARVESDAARIWGCDIVATIQPPTERDLAQMKRGGILFSMLRPLQNHDLVRACADAGITALSWDFVPRITRAQAVDILSAMSSIAGYKAVILAASHAQRMFPMLMTAAGTVTPSKVFVIGAGVAGLQAIATAKRLGAIVEAFDLRPAVKEEVESLGARFVQFAVEGGEDASGSGYAREQSESAQARQREQMAKVIAESDVVITTAMIPGKPAPRLVDEPMVQAMRAGSVIIDLAAETGGNCTLTEPGKTIIRHGVTIVGEANLPATIPFHASQMLARIVTTLLSWIVKKGEISLDFTDKVIDGMTIVHEGTVRDTRVREAMGLPAVAELPAPSHEGAGA